MKELKMLSAKGLYEAPCCEILSLQSDGAILIVSGGVNFSETRGAVSGTDSYDDDDNF